MRTRTYALVLITIGFSLLTLVVAANLVIDPYRVFGTGLLPGSPNVNDRYQKLLAYEVSPQKYDGLVFGSSRSFAISVDDLSRSMDGVSFASFSVVGGMLLDHAAVLDFVLRDKAARGERLRAVFLLLDVDLMGERPFTNSSLQFLMPPGLSGENPLRFWWKNAISIQFKAWESTLRAARRGQAGDNRTAKSESLIVDSLGALGPSPANAQPRAGAVSPRAPDVVPITRTAYYDRQIELLERMVALCRAHNIRLEVAISPIRDARDAVIDRDDLEHAIADVSRIVPTWDFTNADWVSRAPELWLDSAHFRPEVGKMMVRRMFGGEVPAVWTSFGRRLPS